MNCFGLMFSWGAFVLAMLYKQFPHGSNIEEQCRKSIVVGRVVCFGFLVRFKSQSLIRADIQDTRRGNKQSLAKNNGKGESSS